jgi:hypothetical protein
MNVTRRDALISTPLIAALSQIELARAASENRVSDPVNRDGVTRSATRVRGFADPEMDFQLLRSLGAASYMGAAVGEVLAAMRNIQDGDPSTWPAAFAALGEQNRLERPRGASEAPSEREGPLPAHEHVLSSSRVLRRTRRERTASRHESSSKTLPSS